MSQSQRYDEALSQLDLIKRLRDTLTELQAEMAAMRSFHELTVLQRDMAWRELEEIRQVVGAHGRSEAAAWAPIEALLAQLAEKARDPTMGRGAYSDIFSDGGMDPRGRDR